MDGGWIDGGHLRLRLRLRHAGQPGGGTRVVHLAAHASLPPLPLSRICTTRMLVSPPANDGLPDGGGARGHSECTRMYSDWAGTILVEIQPADNGGMPPLLRPRRPLRHAFSHTTTVSLLLVCTVVMYTSYVAECACSIQRQPRVGRGRRRTGRPRSRCCLSSPSTCFPIL